MPTVWIEQVDRLAHHAVRGEMWDKAVALLPAGRGSGDGALGVSRSRGVL